VKGSIFSGLLFHQVVQKHWLGEVEKKHLIIAYFLGNISAENNQNRLVYIKVIASHACELFETQCTCVNG